MRKRAAVCCARTLRVRRPARRATRHALSVPFVLTITSWRCVGHEHVRMPTWSVPNRHAYTITGLSAFVRCCAPFMTTTCCRATASIGRRMHHRWPSTSVAYAVRTRSSWHRRRCVPATRWWPGLLMPVGAVCSTRPLRCRRFVRCRRASTRCTTTAPMATSTVSAIWSS